MQTHENDDRDRPADSSPPEAPLQALYPNLDRVSRSIFKKGTVSRSRVNRSLIGLALVAAAITALIVASTL
jgi:hypothetical protein